MIESITIESIANTIAQGLARRIQPTRPIWRALGGTKMGGQVHGKFPMQRHYTQAADKFNAERCAEELARHINAEGRAASRVECFCELVLPRDWNSAHGEHGDIQVRILEDTYADIEPRWPKFIRVDVLFTVAD